MLKNQSKVIDKDTSRNSGLIILELFAPVIKLDTVRLIISLTTQNNWRIYQMNAKYAFLNEVLGEEAYIEQPAGFVSRG